MAGLRGLQKESIERQIAQWDAPIVEMTGYHIMDLVSRERIKTGRDKDGNMGEN